MALEVIGISELRISKDPGDILITYSLGSCIGLAVYDPVAKVGGMLHYMLPLSKIAPDKARVKPGMFGDTGIPKLLSDILAAGGSKSRLVLKVAGGAEMMDKHKFFNIGSRNYSILKKILWKNSILINSKDIGGFKSRTLKLEMETGKVTIKSSDGVIEL